jgi:hypothetical protein
LVAAAAAVAVLLLAGVLANGRGHGVDTAGGGSDPTLADMATVARQQAPLELSPGQPLLYVRTRAGGPSAQIGLPPRERVDQTAESWLQSDGSSAGQRQVTDATLHRLDAPDPEQPTGTDPPRSTPIGPDEFDLHFTYAQVQGLSQWASQPDQVVAAIKGELHDDHVKDTSVLEVVAGLLGLQVTPPEVRGALYDWLDHQGLRSAGPRTDRAGRQGVAFETTTGNEVFALVVDPSTALALQYTETVGSTPSGDLSSLAPGTVVQFEVYEQQQAVSSTGERP